MPVKQFPAIPFELHEFQSACVADCNALPPGEKLLVASPTGTGKSVIQLKLQSLVWPHSCIITPRLEIIADMLRKLDVSLAETTWAKLPDLGLQYGITTPMRMRNAMLRGEFDPTSLRQVLKDEGHHDNANTYTELDAMLPDHVRQIACTATPYRGTARGTKELHDKWGKPKWAITYPEAMRRGFLSMPTCETWPLVDDDILEVSSTGEFVISRLAAEVANNVRHALKRSVDGGFWDTDTGRPCRATLIGVPSSSVMPQLEYECEQLGLHVRCVTDATPFKKRQEYFRGVAECKYALVHINVVSEGVDLPIRQYLDFASCMSPVLFMQRFGRDTRPVKPGEQPPRYACINRNLERHGYLLDGCLPPSVVAEVQTAFGKPSSRTKSRVFGLESLGKLQGFTVTLTSGVGVTCYNVTAMNGHVKTQYFLILHPAHSNGIWFKKESPRRELADGTYEYDWGKWVAERNPPDDLQGFKSSPPNALSEKQEAMWASLARKHGIDPEQSKLDAKRFALLPVLKDVGVKLQ